MKSTSASALTLVTALTLILTSTAFAQHQPRQLPQNPTNPTNPVNPGSHRYDQPTTIVIPANPSGGFQESMVFGPNGQITIIQQQGTDTFVTTY
jgi:hypothetical protein